MSDSIATESRTETVACDFDYLSASIYRLAVIDRLATSPATPSTIADDYGIHIGNVSNALRELRERGYVELLVDEDRRKGRFHGTTNRGDVAARRLREEEEEEAKMSPNAAESGCVDWDAAGYVEASACRTAVVALLRREDAIPTELADAAGIKIQHVSRTLTELRDKGVVELTVPESRHKNRRYALTDTGHAVASVISEGEQ